MTDRSAVDTATRIVAADDGTNYDRVAISLHWLTALLVLFQFVSSITWDYFSRDTAKALQSVHISLGVVLTAVIIVRIIWRLIPGHQRASLGLGWVQLASKGVHYLLYLLLVAQAALGFSFRWAQGHPVSFFGLFDIPGPYGALDKATRHTLHDLHEKIGWGIMIIALGHALAALYHHYVVKDRVLQRMLPLAR